MHILNPWPLCTRYLATGNQVIITIIKFYHNARIELLQVFLNGQSLDLTYLIQFYQRYNVICLRSYVSYIFFLMIKTQRSFQVKQVSTM